MVQKSCKTGTDPLCPSPRVHRNRQPYLGLQEGESGLLHKTIRFQYWLLVRTTWRASVKQ